ncbi:TetR/AcrR family transcriptional regulator [Kitasatospora aureofaciens]|uniref:TetR family transcriptional regulator n=1 Tax=Kitasatospora aureofaciens TaxID=1894 RepID=A0A1E7N539_KITAU|nr:TetR/AcrR family transcriptional regulator [Kitasatospora aureofaciens]QEV02264.1 TetR/AcrR family transcriptional regulator [Streptomyces viridifaciens]ARF81017.1 TetR family transcriptional regulator [Kitasatospora aureofaciens]OEV35807.1 TetR family transcriptional regulator [Kitasatospora aureofaciens]UKZ08795.1 TetR/AcrR family transcriptional regulator [Streptomyces viridifaciens]GGU63937.1 TetR family transcriptional regulator [Kitasatospora aureofaciens]
MTTVAAETARCPGSVRTPKLRADASRNRERIVLAARDAFVEHGADVPLDEIAKRAGVGNATLYRNFPDRVALIREVALLVKNRILALAETATAEADAPDGGGPFDALQRFVHANVAEKIGGLCTLFSSHIDPHDPDLTEVRERLQSAVGGLMERARAAGELRPDVDHGDLFIAMSQLTRPLPNTSCRLLDEFVHRHLQIFLDGLRTPVRSVLPGRAATFEDFQTKN